MAKIDDYPENEMSISMTVTESGITDVYTTTNLGDDISDDQVETYRRLLEGMMIMLATDSANFLKLSYAADYSEYFRGEDRRQIKEEEEGVEAPAASGGVVSMDAFRRMKTRGEG